MDNKVLEEILRLNKDKKPFCTVSKINDDNVEIIILDNKELSDIQKLAQDALLKDQLIITNYKDEEVDSIIKSIIGDAEGMNALVFSNDNDPYDRPEDLLGWKKNKGITIFSPQKKT